MSNTAKTIEIEGLENLEKAQLLPWVAPVASSKSVPLGSTSHGDLPLASIILFVTIEAIKVLALIMTKNKVTRTIRYTHSYVDEQGISHTVTKEEVFEAEWSNKTTVEAIGKMTDIDPSLILELG